jgi:hypothetical protein
MTSPDKEMYQKLHDWAQIYGEIYCLEVFGSKTFVISKPAAQKVGLNLFVRYSADYGRAGVVRDQRDKLF